MTSNYSLILPIVGFVLVISVVGLLFYLFILVLFEIPEWDRSLKLSGLSKKYNLNFLRAKKGWCGGWLSFGAGEKNFITGLINNIPINFQDAALIKGTFKYSGLAAPTLSEVGNNDGRDATTSGKTILVSKLNDVTYRRLRKGELSHLFEEIKAGQITQSQDVYKLFADKDYSRHFIRNYSASWTICGPLLLLFSAISYLHYPFFSNNALTIIILLNLFINLPIFVWASKAFGKQFDPEDVK